jgi:hypothetical protein
MMAEHRHSYHQHFESKGRTCTVKLFECPCGTWRLRHYGCHGNWGSDGLQTALEESEKDVAFLEGLFEARCKLVVDIKRWGLRVCTKRDGYKAQSRLRGEALEPLARLAEDSPPGTPDDRSLYVGCFVGLDYGDARRARAAVNITPEEAREKDKP